MPSKKSKMKAFFKNVEFDEKSHSYTINGKKAGISTTTLINQYTYEFDENEFAPLTAKKENKTVEQVLEEWHFKRDYACEKGNQIHLFAQAVWKKEKYEIDYSKIDPRFIEQLKIDMEILMPQAIAFYEEFKDIYELVKDEQYLYDDEYDVAGSIDLLLKSKFAEEYIIVDLKSYNELHKKSYHNFKIPLQKYKDNNITHLSTQVDIYKIIFEKNTGLKVIEKFGVYFDVNSTTYKIIIVVNMEREAKRILENRRIRGMNSVPVLIYGKSGTGKSTSLRNFKNEDIAIINVLGKPLPFRNVLKNIVTTDDYATVLENIKKTSRKIVVIDDAGYLITNQFMRTHSKGGGGNAVFAVYNELADNFWNLISEIKKIPGGKRVYFSMHEDTNEFGICRPKTIGKLLDDKVCIEGMFTIAIRTMIEDNKYIFRLKNNGSDVTKTPFDMFDKEFMENDLKELDTVITEYYELDKIEIEDKKEEEEKNVKKTRNL